LRHGPAVQLEYVDLADEEDQTRFPELFAMAEDRNLPYPLVAIDGQLRLTGSAHYFQVLPLVEQALDEENVTQVM
jgi:disulfide oxidoreductase YuzD